MVLATANILQVNRRAADTCVPVAPTKTSDHEVEMTRNQASVAETLGNLTEGNRRFAAGLAQHPNQSPDRRREIAQRQEPLAAILTCADSRITPEIIFDQGLGDLFVARVAGNVADPIVIETLDLAVKGLGINLIMVLGHTRCAAITSAVTSTRGEGPLERALAPALQAARAAGGDVVINTIRENVRLTRSVLARSDEFAATIGQERLAIVGAIYDLDSGRVTMTD